MNILSTIVDENYFLIGLELEGKSSKLGGNGDNIIKKIMTIEELSNQKFKNNQIICQKKNIKEINNFKLKNLPMKRYNNDKYKNINNNLVLEKRLLVNNNLEGFMVSISSAKANYTIKEIIKLSRIYKCENFMIKNRNNKVFICGIPGKSLKTLPELELSKGKHTINRKEKTRTITPKKNINLMDNQNDFDIVGLYEILQDLNCNILKLPSETYKKSKVAIKKTSEDFIDLGIGEIASPYIAYGEQKLNVNNRFKKLGNVTVNFNYKNYNIPTYTVTTKHVFLNGKNYIKKFGIIIKKENIDKLKDYFAKSLALEQITDIKVLEPIRSMLGDKSLEIFEVNTSRLDLIEKAAIKGYILDNKSILDITNKIINIKVEKRYLNHIANEAKEELNSLNKPFDKVKYGIYEGMSDELLYSLTLAGINIYTGIYEKKEDIDIIDKKEDDEDYEVFYGIKGFQTIPSAKDISTKSKKAEKYITTQISNTIDEFNLITDVEEKFKKAEEYLKILDKELKKLVKSLWFHKIACFSNGSYKAFKVIDNESWTLVEKKDNEVKEYVCNESGCENLILKIKGLELL